MNNFAAALGIAKAIQADLPNGKRVDVDELATMFLQWSANESGYGKDPANVAENNYFGIQGGAAGLYGGATVTCNRNGDPILANSTNACFGPNVSWGLELGIALGIQSTTTGVTYLSALESALNKGADMATALQAIATNGWNKRTDYGSYI